MKWIISLLVIGSSLFADVIAIASNGNMLNATISAEASRCSYYIFLDADLKVLEIVENPHKDVQGGASAKLVAMLKEKKVSHIIASRFGDKLINKLKEHKIQYTLHKGDINSAIESLKK